MKTAILKITKDRKINPWSNLTRVDSFLLEKECLTLLNNNFKCICNEPRAHFPKIIEHDEEKFKFILTRCGYTIDTRETWPDYLKDATLNESCQISKQVECILTNLKTNQIKHLDMKPTNLCVNEQGNLSLIDFDIAKIECGQLVNEDIQYYRQTYKKIIELLEEFKII